MAKLTKQYYIVDNGQKRINCYHVNISKEILNKSDINDNDEIKIYEKDGKIIIEKSK